MHTSVFIEKPKRVPRFKKPSKTWKDRVRSNKQFAKNGSFINVKAFVQEELERLEKEDRHILDTVVSW